MNTHGEFNIDFNVDMMVPAKISQKMYGKVFEFTVISTLDGSEVKGEFGSTKKRRLE